MCYINCPGLSLPGLEKYLKHFFFVLGNTQRSGWVELHSGEKTVLSLLLICAPSHTPPPEHTCDMTINLPHIAAETHTLGQCVRTKEGAAWCHSLQLKYLQLTWEYRGFFSFNHNSPLINCFRLELSHWASAVLSHPVSHLWLSSGLN